MKKDDYSVREGEEVKTWFRTNRFITIDKKWYFTTREGLDVGPFKTQLEAERGLELFIDCIVNRNMSISQAASVAMGNGWAVHGFL